MIIESKDKHIAYLRSQKLGLESENEKLRTENKNMQVILIYCLVVIGLGVISLGTLLVVLFNG